jgi:hypothetical protein
MISKAAQDCLQPMRPQQDLDWECLCVQPLALKLCILCSIGPDHKHAGYTSNMCSECKNGGQCSNWSM